MTVDSQKPRSAFWRPPFVACVVVLVGAAVFAGPGVAWFKVKLRKEAVPLRRPLGEFDKAALGEYDFLLASTIDPAVVATLGTELYMNWTFENSRIKKPSDPARRVQILVTYYTGKPSLVPHTPDVCYLGSGYLQQEAANLEFDLTDLDGEPFSVPVRAVTFVKSAVGGRESPTVVYTFHCNGDFVSTRQDVREKLANPFTKGAYFCKIEVSFGWPGASPTTPNRDRCIKAAEKFLARFLPVFLRDHLPDWEAVESAGSAPDAIVQRPDVATTVSAT